MGFYGNITNTAKTQFTFDRTYPNRKTMEARLANDEIYLGRYVLVEYDLTNKQTLDTFLQVQRNKSNGYFYLMGSQNEKNRVRYTETEDPNNPGHGLDNAVIYNQLVYVEDNNEVQTFYKCTGSAGSDGQGGYYAAFSAITISENNYTQNYNIDMSFYGEGRGYDSTVWQKVYTQGAEKFVMIAELNTVVPTFDIVADAPTMTPLTPHFDANSTNVYYKLHWQPQWGMRIAQSEDGKSDMNTAWIRETYNPDTGKTTKEYYNYTTSKWTTYSGTNPPTAAYSVPAAVYWNNDALAAQVDESRTSEEGISKAVGGNNVISVLPTGYSGKTYPRHDGTSRVYEAADIQEFTINLPIVGDVISNAYDIIHGNYRNNSPADSLQGRLNFFKNMSAQEIPVQSAGGYLVGSTMTGDDWIQPTVNVKVLEGDSQYHQDAIVVKHAYDTKNEGQELTTFSCKNGNELEEGLTPGLNHGKGDILKLYTPQIDEMGHVIGNTIETVTLPYGYKTFTIGEQSTGVGELTTNTFEVIADNTQDSMIITSANKWVRLAGEEDKIQIAHAISKQTPVTVGNETKSPKFGESFTIPRFTTDEAGHIISASDQTITLQKGSYTAADSVSDSTEVITQIKFDIPTGDITSTKADSSTLKLASYSAGTDTADVADGDTYNNAFAKLQNQINALDYGNNSTTQIITGITQTDGLIQVTRGNAGTLVLTGYTLDKDNNADIAPTDSINVAFSKLQQQIIDEEQARADAISGLDVDTITTEAYEVIGTISETDGKISASKKKAGELTLSGYSKPTSGSAVDQSDTLNAALGKLEYKLDTEIKRVDDLDYTDPNTNTTQIITKVTQTDGKIEVVRSNAGTLLLTDYTIGTNGEKIASTDSINTAFAKLQTQINNVIGSEEIATNFDNIKKISDWLSANDSNADQVIDDIATLKGDASVTNSVQNQIKSAIEGLDSEKTVTAGNYISGIHIEDGKITSIDETALPEISWDNVTNKPDNLVTSDQIANMVEDTDIQGMVTESTPFTYPAIADASGAEISAADATMTIALLIKKVAALEARIYALENPTTNETPEPTPEEGGEETPTE